MRETRNVVTLSHLDPELEQWCKGEGERRSRNGPKVGWSAVANEMIRLGRETYIAKIYKP